MSSVPNSLMISFYIVVTFLSTQVAADSYSDDAGSTFGKIFGVLVFIFIIYCCCCDGCSGTSKPDPVVVTQVAEVTPAPPTHAVIVIREVHQVATISGNNTSPANGATNTNAPPTYQGVKNDAIIPL
ncbi:hypothetical protein BDR26DRAFT_627778 [Obelidium mucronatum]|nr:hypothetical protein BDR26DRAFT_627778 [Obelidium mucronatum]